MKKIIIWFFAVLFAAVAIWLGLRAFFYSPSPFGPQKYQVGDHVVVRFKPQGPQNGYYPNLDSEGYLTGTGVVVEVQLDMMEGDPDFFWYYRIVAEEDFTGLDNPYEDARIWFNQEHISPK